MQHSYLLSPLLLFLPLAASAQEKNAAPYKELSRLIHKAVVTQMPRSHEDTSGWGGTIPIGPEKLRLPSLRTRLKVDGKDVFPHGFWKRYQVRVEEPAQDVAIQVTKLARQENGLWRLSLDASALVRLEGEFRQYQKGLLLLGITGNADVVLTASLDFDVSVELVPGKLPPDVKVKPEVVGTKLDVADFKLGRVGKLEIVDPARRVDGELRGFLSTLIKTQESAVQEYANQAITRALEQGKGTISTAELFKLVPKKEK